MPRKAVDPSTNGTRPVEQGDTSPDLSPAGIEHFTVAETTEAAREAQVSVVKDLLTSASPEDQESVAHWLAAVIAGTSPDDRAVLRTALFGGDTDVLFGTNQQVYGVPPMNADDELVDDRRGRLPLPQPDVPQELRAPEVPAAGGAAEAPGLGEGHRASGW